MGPPGGILRAELCSDAVLKLCTGSARMQIYVRLLAGTVVAWHLGTAVGGWVDVETPKDALTKASLVNGKTFHLVFSGVCGFCVCGVCVCACVCVW